MEFRKNITGYRTADCHTSDMLYLPQNMVGVIPLKYKVIAFSIVVLLTAVA